MHTRKIRVLIVEDQLLVREGTRVLVEKDPSIEVVAEADNASDAVRLAAELQPDVILLDIRLRSGSGLDVARSLQKSRSEAKVVVLTAYDYEQYVEALVRAGVSGYLLKDVSGDELVQAIHQAYEGYGVLAGKVAAAVLRKLSQQRMAPGRPPEELTVREVEVLELLEQGISNQDMALRLGTSRRTVETHVANILGKLGATSRRQAVQLAIERGYIKPHPV